MTLGVIYQEGGEKWPGRRIGGEWAYGGWIPDWIPKLPGPKDSNVGPMAVSRDMAEQLGMSGEGLLSDPAHNIIVGTAYLSHRYWQGAGSSGLQSVGGDSDAAWTLVFSNYVNWDKAEPEWDASGILARPLFRNFCARLPTIRSDYA